MAIGLKLAASPGVSKKINICGLMPVAAAKFQCDFMLVVLSNVVPPS